MIKATLLVLALSLGTLTHVTYPGRNSPYGSQTGLFVPHIHKVESHTNASDVLYTRFCKAICYLYVPLEKTCGLNNKIYENDCQARCDRVGTDIARLKFNQKCCCSGGSHLIDASFAQFAANSVPTPAPAATCVHIASGNHLINVFAIPPCISRCLGIDSYGDLEFLDNTLTYIDGCADNED